MTIDVATHQYVIAVRWRVRGGTTHHDGLPVYKWHWMRRLTWQSPPGAPKSATYGVTSDPDDATRFDNHEDAAAAARQWRQDYGEFSEQLQLIGWSENWREERCAVMEVHVRGETTDGYPD